MGHAAKIERPSLLRQDQQAETLTFVRKLMDIGRALSEEKDNGRLLERILRSAKELTGADGGSLYLRTDDDHLRFEIILTDSLDLYLGGTHGRPIRFPPIPLFGLDGEPNNQMVAARAATAKHTINIEDAYAATGFDFSGTRLFDARNGYRSASFLTVPMLGQSDEVIGVLQLINAIDPMTREVVAFGPRDQQLAESLASQAAIALTNKRLVDEQRYLFEAFIELMAGAIDDKSPYTGGHCRRVPELTMMLADAAAAQSDGPLRDFSMTDADRYELKIAGWLHDCGKITTPEYIVDKATKLQTIFDRIELVQTRFELAMREAEVRTLREKVKELSPDVERDLGEIESVVSTELSTLRDDYEFVSKANIGGEMMSDEHIERVHHIASREVTIADGSVALLNEDEVKNLCIRRGTLTEEEREVINHHIVATIKMLEALPYPPHLRRVPEFAGGHHERMDGRGYPRGLTREEMSVQARIMGIADIFEALTAGDRPYKKAMPLSQALRILGSMKVDNHIDPDLFDVFMKERIYLRYAELFLPSEQVDEVDLAHIPGYISDS